MEQTKNAATIKTKTGIDWEDWVEKLDSAEAKNLEHAAIVKLVQNELESLDLDINKGCWAQSITVGYEKAIGRRTTGQRADGTYEVAVSKTLMYHHQKP